ncbi:protein-disulfide reductase DsbD domain-containing protein [uncultured Psychrobacter sp.]|uniref:cytochrome c biogenesis protein CcdA n=2 Tax=uncultured Psychrobacter sp. TaxID=259303 RepID=UPI0026341179|nr:protein-disulfide reductase DsbD domain-containing protein [uncultured Psychrobacter sp.]
MSIKTSMNHPAPTKKARSAAAYLLALGLSSSSLVTGVAVTGLMAVSTTSQAASLSDLFGNSSDKSPKFLSVEEAFQVTSSTQPVAKGTQLSINFDITPEHYVYKDQLKLDLPAGVSASAFKFSQKPVSIDDPTYGQVPVFDQANVVASTTLTSTNGKSISGGEVTIGWQGCAKAGLCYPPEKIKTTVSIDTNTSNASDVNNSAKAVTAASSDNTATSAQELSSTAASDEAIDYNDLDSDAIDYDTLDSGTLDSGTLDSGTLNSDMTATSSVSGDDSSIKAEESTSLVSDGTTTSSQTHNTSNTSNNGMINGLGNEDPFGLATHPWLALLLLFVAGLGLALTPCVLPMLPIVANIVARQENPTVKRGVILTTSYALGVSIAYGLLGAVIAIFGESLGIIGWLQNPIILISFAIVFVLLALYMLGVFTIRLPHAMSNKLHKLSQAGDSKLGSTSGSLVAGFLSALVVSPCVSAPLFGVLLAVSTIGSPLLGFIALFMLGFGLSAPLILIGATQGKIIPKAGAWMDWVKQGFALLLFAVALLMIERVFISPVMLLVWALWFMVVATWAWSWVGRARMLTQALGLVVGIWATMLIIGAALGNEDSLYPLASLTAAPTMVSSVGQNSEQAAGAQATDEHVTTLAELDTIIAANPKVIVDVTAEWCIECRIMEKNLFHNRPAQMQDWQLVRLDITETTADSKAILARYQLFGPPSLLYYVDGELVNKQVGEIGRQQFEQTLTALNN